MLSSAAWGTTYYGDIGQSGTGKPGTTGDPYSFADMCNLALAWGAGDTILVRGRAGNLTVTSQAYGTDGNDVIWLADPNGEPPDCNMIQFTTADADLYLTIDGWTIDRGWLDTYNSYLIAAVRIYKEDYLTFKNCTIHGSRRSVWSTGDFYPYHDYGDTSSGGIGGRGVYTTSGSTASYITFEDCVFSNSQRGVSIEQIGNTNWTFTDCKFYRSGEDCVVIGGANGPIAFTNCEFYDANHFYGMFGYTGTDQNSFNDPALTQTDTLTYYTAGNVEGGSGFFAAITSGTMLRIVADDMTAVPERYPAGGTWRLDSNPNKRWLITATGGSNHNDLLQVDHNLSATTVTVNRCIFRDGLGQLLKASGGIFYVYNSLFYFTKPMLYPGTYPFLLEADHEELYLIHNFIDSGYENGVRDEGRAFRTSTAVPQYLRAYNNFISGITIKVLTGGDVDFDYNIFEQSESEVQSWAQGDPLHDTYDADFSGSSYFVDYANEDFNTVGVPQSPGINAGDANNTTTSDFTAVANIRVDNAPPDIGPYEFITFSGENNPPVLAAIGNKTVRENALLSFAISATDADSDPITYYCTNPPDGAVFSTATFTWTPTYYQSGSYEVRFVASDTIEIDDENITIIVTNVPQYFIGF